MWLAEDVSRGEPSPWRKMRRRAANEPVIGHRKDDHRMRPNHLEGRDPTASKVYGAFS